MNRLFRNTDPVESIPELQPQPEVKLEPEETDFKVEPEQSENSASSSTESSDENGSVKQAQFVQIKNREVFDYEPQASSIHASLWPHWWLKAVRSRHCLRKSEAKKNQRFKVGLKDLFQEALKVGTIKSCS